jgi:hypothetical protein
MTVKELSGFDLWWESLDQSDRDRLWGSISHLPRIFEAGRAEGERAVFEKACKAVCKRCDDDDDVVWDAEWKYWIHEDCIRCTASDLRVAFPHLAKPE